MCACVCVGGGAGRHAQLCGVQAGWAAWMWAQRQAPGAFGGGGGVSEEVRYSKGVCVGTASISVYYKQHSRHAAGPVPEASAVLDLETAGIDFRHMSGPRCRDQSRRAQHIASVVASTAHAAGVQTAPCAAKLGFQGCCCHVEGPCHAASECADEVLLSTSIHAII
jgi:hypothetical protein